MIRWISAAAALSACTPALAQGVGKPIIDMHLHARRAHYAGTSPPPMCAPFAVMPRSDPRNGIYEGMETNVPPCAHPIPAETTDEAVLTGTVDALNELNIFGVVSGEPDLVAKWVARAPARFMPAVDYRLPGTAGQKHVAPKPIELLRALHRRGRIAVIGEIMAQYEGVCGR